MTAITHHAAAWPFPGSSTPPPVYDLPPPAFGVGDRVATRWGSGTVCGVCDWPCCDDSRAYIVHHDWSCAPPDFGHVAGEASITRLIEAPAAPSTEATTTTEAAQMALF